MSATRQKAIRAALVAKLASALGSGVNVEASRNRPLNGVDHPAVLVYSVDDTPHGEDFDHLRIYTVRCEVRVLGSAEDDATDDLADQVRRAVLEDDSLGGLASRIVFRSQAWDSVELDQFFAASALDFAITYLIPQ